MKLGEFINNLAKKCGQEQNPALVSLLSNSDFANREVEDSFAAALDSNLMSLESAKNNRTLLDHFKPIILKGIDNSFEAIGTEFELGDDFMNEPSSYKKAEMLQTKIKAKVEELSKKAKNTPDAAKEAEYLGQIKTLQSKLQELTTEKETAIANVRKESEMTIKDMFLDQHLNSFAYANEVIPKNVNTLTAKNLIMQEAEKLGATFILKDGKLTMKQKTLPEMDVLDSNNNVLSFDTFTQKVLADNQLLKVSGQSSSTPAQQTTVPITIPGQSSTVNSHKFDSAAASSLADLGAK